jgi:hypothetical protein
VQFQLRNASTWPSLSTSSTHYARRLKSRCQLAGDAPCKMDKIGIAGAIREADMQALRNLIDEGYTVISTIDFPRGAPREPRKLRLCPSTQ